jgi:hypothetical protein
MDWLLAKKTLVRENLTSLTPMVTIRVYCVWSVLVALLSLDQWDKEQSGCLTDYHTGRGHFN